MRLFYTALFYCLLPLMLLRMLWRSRKAPAYARRWNERFGFFEARKSTSPAIWVHAVSVGETLAAMPMLRELQVRFPDYELIVTSTTPTGSERVRAALGDSVFHLYAPYDLPDCVARFIGRARPNLAIIMETELWPNTIHACASASVPVLVANARLSERSARGYQHLAGLSRAMVSSISLIAAQSQDDAERFLRLGVAPDAIEVTGNIKFDLTLDLEQQQQAKRFRQRWDGDSKRQILLAASTHEGEDALLLKSMKLLSDRYPRLLMVLVPRHPERFRAVAELAGAEYKVQLHSSGEPVTAATRVLIGDSMGELPALLGASDLVFMGGTWVDNGGHNLIEPAAWGKPLLSGPSLFNFSEVSRLLLEAGAMAVVQTPQELADSVARLLDNPEEMAAVGVSAQQVAQNNRGALERLLNLIAKQLCSNQF